MNIFKKIFIFYVDGFRNIDSLGKKVWIIIAIKLFIIFAILRLFFFPDFLNSKYDTEKEKGDHVIENITIN